MTDLQSAQLSTNFASTTNFRGDIMKKKLLSKLLVCTLALQTAFASTVSMPANTKKASAALTGKSPFTNSTYTHNDTFSGYKIYHGIDVSKYNNNNGTIDWNKDKKAGVDFVIVRVGYRGYGKSGTLCTDPFYKTNIEGALAAGIKVGVYYFTEALTTSEAKEEAKFCIDKIKDYDITLPVAIDYEYPTDGSKPVGRMYNAKLSKSAATANVKAFCAAVKDAGYTPLVYANKSDFSSLIDGASIGKSYKVWLANYTTKTTYANKYEYWQYTSSGKVNGITGKVDCNFWYTKSKLDDTSSTPAPAATNTPKPTASPTVKPTAKPTAKPTVKPTVKPTAKPTAKATAKPTVKPTAKPSGTKMTAPKNFRAVSGTKAITLKWTKSSNAAGYQIFRKNFYDGSYKNVKIISNVNTTTYKDTKVTNGHEYYYKIRSINKTASDTTYSNYASLTASASKSRAGITQAKHKLLKKPSAQSDAFRTLPKNSIVEYLGKTVYKNNTTFIHVNYYIKGKKNSVYLPADAKLKYYKGGTAKQAAKLYNNLSSLTKPKVKIPKGSYLAVLKTQKAGKVKFYKVRYSDTKKSYVGYVNAKYVK